jgi:hypothetical protein
MIPRGSNGILWEGEQAGAGRGGCIKAVTVAFPLFVASWEIFFRFCFFVLEGWEGGWGRCGGPFFFVHFCVFAARLQAVPEFSIKKKLPLGRRILGRREPPPHVQKRKV